MFGWKSIWSVRQPFQQAVEIFCDFQAFENPHTLHVTCIPQLCCHSLSLSLIPSRGVGHCPNPFQVTPEASRISCEGVSWPGVPHGVIVGRTLEHQMLDHLVGALAVWTVGRLPAPDTVTLGLQAVPKDFFVFHCSCPDLLIWLLCTILTWSSK